MPYTPKVCLDCKYYNKQCKGLMHEFTCMKSLSYSPKTQNGESLSMKPKREKGQVTENESQSN
jgi:hypothetical protein